MARKKESNLQKFERYLRKRKWFCTHKYYQQIFLCVNDTDDLEQWEKDLAASIANQTLRRQIELPTQKMQTQIGEIHSLITSNKPIEAAKLVNKYWKQYRAQFGGFKPRQRRQLSININGEAPNEMETGDCISPCNKD